MKKRAIAAPTPAPNTVLRRQDLTKPDGRKLFLYTFAETKSAPSTPAASPRKS